MAPKPKIPRLPELLEDLTFLGLVESTRTVYYVFLSGKDYIIFSYKSAAYKSGNFNVVMADMVERVKSTFSGKKRVTRKMVMEHPRMKKFAKDFDVLQALYILIALEKATFDKRSPNDRTLYFNIKK